MFNLQKIHPATFLLSKEGAMRVPGLIIGNEEQLQLDELEMPLKQVKNVACLPGIIGYSIAMPDMHWGYGFPIGGVAAMDAEEGVISPGGVGYDINCGVRLATIPIAFQQLKSKTKDHLLNKIFHLIPSGAGQGQHEKSTELKQTDYRKMMEQGAAWSIEKGYGFEEDLSHSESHGFLTGADLKAVSDLAQSRGRNQLGSIGSGNHFVEIGEIDEIFVPEIADPWRLKKGQTYVLIHTGSRGFGHQICQDTLNLFIKKGFAEGLPDKQLVAAPIQSPEGRQYWAAMAAAANFAFNNRQQILHAVRKAFEEVCNIPKEDVHLLYDVCHNIAKMEDHIVDGVHRKLCVHRKGATRAYGPGALELAPIFQETGQPVLIPGDMGRASYVLAGLSNPLTWCSACHGAGRARSRVKSLKAWQGRQVIDHMQKMGVKVMAHSNRTIAEEMPDAYKDVNQVVEAVAEAKLAKKIAKLRPFLVLKG